MEVDRKLLIKSSISFILSFSVAFIVMGASASMVGFVRINFNI